MSGELEGAESAPDGADARVLAATMPETVKRRTGAARLAEALKRQDWVAVSIELLVVVVGVLVALWLNQSVERRQTRALEHTYLLRLKEDLQMEQEETQHFTRIARDRLAAVSLLDTLATNPLMPLKDSRAVVCALATVSWGSFPPIHNISYDELQSTGRTSLIRSVALRRALAEHYAMVADFARPGLSTTDQDRFESNTVGLLSTPEMIAIERADGDCSRTAPVSSPHASAIATAWAKRQAAIDDLPGLAKHHEFNLRVMEGMKARIDALIAQLDNEIAGDSAS